MSKIMEFLQKNKVLVIGILVSDTSDWSKIIQELHMDEELERKMGSIIFFKIGREYHLEIHNQLKEMLTAIKNLI
jgi:hypothetical protein